MSSRAGGSRSGSGRRRLHAGGNGWEERGGYMNAKIRKLEEQFQKNKSANIINKGPSSQLFAGVAIFINGHTIPTAADLRSLMAQHGGTFHAYRSSRVTHIVATNLAESKARGLTTQKVVRPEWIMDSLKKGKLLSHEPYLLYTARTQNQPGLENFTNKSAAGKMCTPASSSSEPSSSVSVTRNSMIIAAESNADSDTNQEVTSQMTDDAPGRSTLIIPDNQTPDVVTSTENICRVKTAPLSACSSGMRGSAAAGSTQFLSEFYSHSRLHHISTWGAEYKAYVSKLHREENPSFEGREKLRAWLAEVGGEGEYRTGGKPKLAIMHVDMDCFFVSVGLRNKPHLVGKPVAVTHSRGKGIRKDREGTDLKYELSQWAKKGLKVNKGRGRSKASHPASCPFTDPVRNPDLVLMAEHRGGTGDADKGERSGSDEETPGGATSNCGAVEAFHSMAEIASCSYEARKAGVRNGMFMGTARKLCPNLVSIAYDFDGYSEVSRTLYDTVASYTHDIEAVSCDEMLVDLTDLLADVGASPLQFASHLRQEISRRTGCSASAGLGPNILLARMATRVAKPNGEYFLDATTAAELIQNQSVVDLPGVGRAMQNKLRVLDVTTCGDLQKMSLAALQKEFGPKIGQSLYRFCRGQDDRPIKCEHERKSVSAEINYGIRFTTKAEVEQFMTELSGEVQSRLNKLGLKGKTITLKLKVRAPNAPKETAKFLGHGICDNVAKSTSIAVPTDDHNVIVKEVLGLLRTLVIPPSEFRGVGIQLSRLEALPTGGPSAAAAQGRQSILNFATKVDGRKDSSHVEDKCTRPTKDIESLISENDHVCTSRRSPLCNQGNRPPLPTLPDFRTPKPGTSEEVRRLEPSSSISDFYLPSPTQIDKDVLKELPKEIRVQIEEALEAQKGPASAVRSLSRKALANVADVHVLPVTDRPGTDSQTDDPIVPLPSYSKLDPSCLDALPPEVRAELVEAYKQQSDREQATVLADKQSLHPLMKVKIRGSPCKSSHSKSPARRTSPGKTSKRSPNFKKPKGKVLNKNRKRLAFTDESPAQVSTRTTDLRIPSPYYEVTVKPTTSDLGLELSESTSDPQDASGTSRPGCVSPQKHVDAPPNLPHPRGVHLCGAVTLEDVKTLIHEWTLSCEAPRRDDVDHLHSYLYNLVEDQNLERLCLVIKYLRRCLARRRLSVEWEQTFEEVRETSQSIVQAAYGSQLRL